MVGRIENALAELMKSYRQARQEELLGYESTNYLLDFIHIALKKLDNIIDKFSEPSRITYKKHTEKVQGWLHLVKLDLDLRKNHKKTLTPTYQDSSIYKEIERFRDNYQVAQEKVQHFLPQLRDLESLP